MTGEPKIQTDSNGVWFPGANWALWDADGNLARHQRFDEPTNATDVLDAWSQSHPHVYTIAEFTDDRWAELTHAIGAGADTSLATWAT